MNKFFCTIFFLVISINYNFAQIPNGYYNSADGLTGITLKTALHNIIKAHTSVSYSSLLNHYTSTDKKANGKVWDMYSDNPGGTPPYEYTFSNNCGNYAGEGDCYNREHSWPQSWFNDASPMVSDLFHVYPTDGYVNGKRSNWPYGKVNSPSWTSQNGSKLGPCSFTGYTGTAFEPIDAYKGDFARTYFYMSVRYYLEDGSWNSNDMVTKSELNSWALKQLYEWHLSDTVSQKEIDRNNAVYQIQNNRNPFIDNPQWVLAIWSSILGNKDVSNENLVNIFPNPAKDNISISIVNYNNYKISYSLLNKLGQEVIAGSLNNGNNSIELNSLNSGAYIAQINIGENKVYKKIIITH